jgi:hypothetical protein
MEYVTSLRTLVHTFADLVLLGTFIPLLIQQSRSRNPCFDSRTHPAISHPAILAGMILFKGFTTPAKGEHAKSIMSVVMREYVTPLPPFPHFPTNLLFIAVQSSTSQSSSPS